jgi:tRNA-Thr(GGU) m(6)t(6)A37 methyltransferase TsaA
VALKEKYELIPIGRIHNQDKSAWIEIFEPYRDAMDGLEEFSHINVLYWFDENDTPEGRSVLKVHPCRNPENPLTGVFATHSPMRPNLIALTLCRITKIEGLIVHLDAIDARDGSPLLDIKSYFPPDDGDVEARRPKWAGRPKDAQQTDFQGERPKPSDTDPHTQ